MPNKNRLNTINLYRGTPTQKRKEIRRYYDETLALEEKLYSALAVDEAFYQRADPLRHPLIFYYGHTAVFMINKLMLAQIIQERIRPELESIFAIGVDEMSWDDLNEAHYDWPSVSETKNYRAAVAAQVRQLIDDLPLELPITWESPFWPILMGIEHLKIHIETSSVLMRQLPIDMLKANTLGKRCLSSQTPPENELIQVPGGQVLLGKSTEHHLYGWDCEYGQKTSEVNAFQAAKYLVSNQEFLAFVESQAYHQKKYWSEEGWQWRSYTQAEHPRFWIKNAASYDLRLMDEIIPMPWDWPVEINYLEAKAFCEWKSEQSGLMVRMPTEAEWWHLYMQEAPQDIDEWTTAPGNINLEHYSSPCPVNQFAFGAFYDLIGNVWQWTETAINGYPGFKVHPLYDDFSAPTFDQKHNLFKGGSWISTGNEASRHARYAFRRHFYQHAGFRYIVSDYPPEVEDQAYEDDPEVAIACEANYGNELLGFPNFYKELSHFCLKHLNQDKKANILDINCETGRLAFELSASGAQVTALDASARFIKMAIDMQNKGRIKYLVKDEGELFFYREKSIEELNIDAESARNIQFMQVDAANAKPIYTGYDMIIASGLLEELYDPIHFLSQIHERLQKNGLLVLGSSYAWEQLKNGQNAHLGGYKKDGETLRSFEGIKNLLSPHFELIEKPFNLPKVLRLTSRNFEVKQEEISLWRKR